MLSIDLQAEDCWSVEEDLTILAKGECLEEMAPNKKRHQIQKGKKLEGKNKTKNTTV